MVSPSENSRNIVPMAVLVEGGLGLLAVVLGWVLRHPPGEMIRWTAADAAWGVLATLPLVAVLAVSIRIPWRPLRNLLKVVDELIVPLFRDCRLIELAAISALAGFGEEALFRGVIQNALAGAVGGSEGVFVGLLLAAVIFGALHWITPAYAVLATLIGLYLGGLLIVTDNLLVPIVAHGLYDFLALVYLVRVRRREADTADISGEDGLQS